MKIYMTGLVAILVITVAIWALGYTWQSALFAQVATLGWILGAIGWIVFQDSKNRWPDKSTFMRFAYLITFHR